jgi:cobalt-zinc-cadmium efflux system protein
MPRPASEPAADPHAGHDHSHGGHDRGGHAHGGHGHAHAPADFNRAFAVGVALNIAFVAGEVVYGLSAHSLALISDAGHNLSDVLGLLLAWAAIRLAKSRPTARRTYGLRRSSILAALANAGLLLVVTGAVTWEAIRRLAHPEPVAAMTIVWVATVGIVINGATAMMFFSGRRHDVNIRGAYLHMASDAIVAAGVVLSGLLIRWTGWLWVDPAVSIAIGGVITLGTWGLLRESMNLAMDAVPEHINPDEVQSYFTNLSGVRAVHDLHIWAMSTTETALTVHLVTPTSSLDDARLATICRELNHRFRIGHATIQLERGDDAHPCDQASHSTV